MIVFSKENPQQQLRPFHRRTFALEKLIVFWFQLGDAAFPIEKVTFLEPSGR